MPHPSTALSRPDLGGSLMEFDNEANRAGFIGLRVFPVFESARQNAEFGKFKIESLLQERDTTRAAGAGYARQQNQFTTDNFATREHGAEEPVDDRESKIYATYFDAEMVAARRARDVVLRNLEKRVKAKVQDTATWTGAALTTAVGTPWTMIATSTPITDVRGAVIKVYQNSGMLANRVVLSWEIYQKLLDNTQILDRIKSWGGDDPLQVNKQTLARAFDVEEVVVGGGVFNSANEGQAASLSGIWANSSVMVCRVATGNDLKEPCIGRTIHWGEDGSSIGAAMESYRDESIRGDVVRARMDTDEKRLFTQAGHLLTNIG